LAAHFLGISAASHRIFCPIWNDFLHLYLSWLSSLPVAMWLPSPLATKNWDLAHMALRITKRTVDQLTARNRDAVVWDTEVKGFGVRCRASGAKHYVLKMRVGDRQR